MAHCNYSSQGEVRLHGHKVLGTFSTDTERRYCKGDRNRRFFLEPDDELEFDYTRGFESYVDMGDDPVVSLNSVLRWMRDNRKALIDGGILDPKRSRLNVDFVGRRGLLGRLLEARSNKDHHMTLLLTLYRGTYYISETSDDWRSTGKQDLHGQMIAASSKLFLQFVRSKDGRTRDTPTPVNDNASFYAMMRANCGKHRMLFSFEVQAEKKDSTASPPGNYVNVRTNGQQSVHPMKALKWWAPNALSGIPQIVCGVRNDKRKIIEKVKYIRTDQLPTNYAQVNMNVFTSLVSDLRVSKWQPVDCIKNMESLLSQIKDVVQDDDANSVYKLVLEPVEGGRGQEQRLRSRKLVFKGMREDDFTLITESQIAEILGR